MKPGPGSSFLGGGGWVWFGVVVGGVKASASTDDDEPTIGRLRMILAAPISRIAQVASGSAGGEEAGSASGMSCR